MLLAPARRRCAYTNDMLGKGALLLEDILEGATYLSVVTASVFGDLSYQTLAILSGYLYSATLNKNGQHFKLVTQPEVHSRLAVAVGGTHRVSRAEGGAVGTYLGGW